MLKASGTIKVEREKSRIVVDVSPDIVDYYQWFIKKYYWIKLQKPLHEAHITLAKQSLHETVDWKKAIQYDKKQIDFEYDPYLIRGGYTKGFIMFYLKVYSEMLDKIKKELNIIDNDGYRGLHITIGNGKGGVRPYWPEMISIV